MTDNLRRAGLTLLIIVVVVLAIALARKEPAVKLVPVQAPIPVSDIWRITAYCPNKCCCGRYADYIMASGHFIKHKDKFIAAPKNIPFGTWVNVPGYGYAEVLDRGGAIKGKRLDVFFSTHQEALNWGVKYLTVKAKGEI